MQLWAAALLSVACVGGAAVFANLYGKSGKARFIALTGVVSLLALTSFVYVVLTFILLGRAGG